MAYITKEQTQQKRQELKKVTPKGWKLSVTNKNYSKIYISITQANIDIPQLLARIGINHNQLNHFYIVEMIEDRVYYNYYFDNTRRIIACNLSDEEKKQLLFISDTFKNILKVANDGNHDNSDIQTDYFDIGWYIGLAIGTDKKEFQLK